MIYCVIPRDLADELHEELRGFYGGRSNIEVVVDRRSGPRRDLHDRRTGQHRLPAGDGRRRDRRNSAERRAAGAHWLALTLPELAGHHADRIKFARLTEPDGDTTSEDRDTARIVRLARSGDGRAFEQVYMRYYERVYFYLSRMLQDQHEGEDATQEVFVRVFRALPGYRQTATPFRAWLFTIARNVALNRLRLPLAIVHDGEEAPFPARRTTEASHGVLAEDVFDGQLMRIIEQLPLDQQRVLFLRYSLDLTQAHAARVLGRSADAVRMLEARATRHLGERLAPLRTATGRAQRFPMRMKPPRATVLAGRRWALLPSAPHRW